MIDRLRCRLTSKRCWLVLGAAALSAVLLWLLAHQLLSAVYHGHAGGMLNALITGQSEHPLRFYYAVFDRLYLAACAGLLISVLAYSLLPDIVHNWIRSLPAWLFAAARAGLTRNLRLSALQIGVLVAGTFLVLSLFSPWKTTTIRLSDTYDLGKTYLLSGPDACNGQSCYELEIKCAELSRPENALLRVGQPDSGVEEQGTIMFFSGWTGNFWWDWDSTGEEKVPDDERQIEIVHKQLLADLQAAGYRTVQVKWESGWFDAAPGKQENPPLLACNPATLANWVFRELRKKGPEQAFCAVGHSNGATELGYMLSRYNQEDIFSLVVMESGPNWARLDYSCIPEPAHPELINNKFGRSTIDLAYGYPNDGTGICARQDHSQIELFRRTSIILDYVWSYYYPHTQVAIVVSKNDSMVGRQHAEYYYDRLLKSGSPLLSFDVLPGDGHVPTATPEGADWLETTLLNECREHQVQASGDIHISAAHAE